MAPSSFGQGIIEDNVDVHRPVLHRRIDASHVPLHDSVPAQVDLRRQIEFHFPRLVLVHAEHGLEPFRIAYFCNTCTGPDLLSFFHQHLFEDAVDARADAKGVQLLDF